MTMVQERVELAQRRVGRWRRRTVLALVLVLALGATAAWALTRGPASALVARPIVHGSGLTAPQCEPDVPRREIEDTFGGGGTVLRYREGTRCRFGFTIENRSKAAVTVQRIERTDDEFIQALRLVDADRSRGPLYTVVRCIGCPEEQVPFTPFVMQPGEEWAIGVQGLMDGCSPPKGGFEAGGRGVIDTVDITVESLGVRRVVPIALRNPIGIALDECRG